MVTFGVFVEILPGKEGLLHISEIEWRRFEKIEDAGLKEGDEIEVKLLEIDKAGKLRLSHKALLPKPEGYAERPERGEQWWRPSRQPPRRTSRAPWQPRRRQRGTCTGIKFFKNSN